MLSLPPKHMLFSLFFVRIRSLSCESRVRIFGRIHPIVLLPSRRTVGVNALNTEDIIYDALS